MADPNNGTDNSKTMRHDLSGLAAGEAAVLNADLLNDFSDDYTLRDPTDKTKQALLDLSDVPTATTRNINVEALHRNGSYVETIYTAGGTHTFATSSKFFQVYAAGGGAGGGGVDGQGAGTKASASGGGSGFNGQTTVITRGAIATGTVTIGAGGAGGAGLSGASGTNGGDTTWSDGTNSFTFGGGKAGIGAVADTSTAGVADPPNVATASAGVIGTCDRRTLGYMRSPPTNPPGFVAQANGGIGGDSLWGRGGTGGNAGGTGSGAAGGDATNYGAGGGGAAVTEISTNFAGGAGSPGILIVREW
jgi:hypothetical protein